MLEHDRRKTLLERRLRDADIRILDTRDNIVLDLLSRWRYGTVDEMIPLINLMHPPRTMRESRTAFIFRWQMFYMLFMFFVTVVLGMLVIAGDGGGHYGTHYLYRVIGIMSFIVSGGTLLGLLGLLFFYTNSARGPGTEARD